MTDHDLEQQLGRLYEKAETLDKRLYSIESYIQSLTKSSSEWDAQLGLVLKLSSKIDEALEESTSWKAKVNLMTRLFYALFAVLTGGIGVFFLQRYWR